jgi:thimet oligopeptidase
MSIPKNELIDWSRITIDYLDDLYKEYIDYSIKESNDFCKLIDDESNLNWFNIYEKDREKDIELTKRMVLLDMDQLHPNKEIRDKCVELNKKLSTFAIEQSMRKDIFEVYKKYYDTNYQVEKNSLTQEQNKYMEKTMIGFRMKGLYLDEETSEKVKEISKIMSIKSTDYQQNISNFNDKLDFYENEFCGLEVDWLVNRLDKDTGKYIIKAQYPDYVPIMEYCHVRETRRKMYLFMNSRCIEPNVEICMDIIRLRKEKCGLFGFDSHANFKLQNQMAKNSQNVMDFLTKLKSQIIPIAQYDLSKLLELAKSDGIEKLEVWDTAYYSRIYTEKVSSLDMKDLKRMFSIDSVTTGILEIYSHLLGLKFTNVTSEYSSTLYHDDIMIYTVQDSKTLDLMGYFYLDLYPRDGKYSHAAVFPLIRKSVFSLPVAAIVCNFDPKLDVEFDNVVTYFHEFGHLMHNMCSTNTIASLAGTQVERDFVETPSQMFEEWVYSIEPLKKLVKKEYVNEITVDLVNKINVQNKTLQGLFNARQLSFGLLDMELHSVSNIENPKLFYTNMYKELTGLDIPNETNILGSFSHIIGGYDSGYYGYLWSKVFAIDLFSFFKGRELDQELGLRLREKILSVGGTKTGYEMLEDFMGRSPNSDAFIEWLLN